MTVTAKIAKHEPIIAYKICGLNLSTVGSVMFSSVLLVSFGSEVLLSLVSLSVGGSGGGFRFMHFLEVRLKTKPSSIHLHTLFSSVWLS